MCKYYSCRHKLETLCLRIGWFKGGHRLTVTEQLAELEEVHTQQRHRFRSRFFTRLTPCEESISSKQHLMMRFLLIAHIFGPEGKQWTWAAVHARYVALKR